MAKLKRNQFGSIILPSGEKITRSEQKALRSAVSSANRKSKRILSLRPKELVQTKYNMFGNESDWLLRKKSVSFNRFKNKAEFNKYLKSVKNVASGAFERNRNKVYFENYKRAIRNVFGSKSRDLIIKINRVGDKKLIDAIIKGELEAEIGYIYDPENFETKYNQISTMLSKLER